MPNSTLSDLVCVAEESASFWVRLVAQAYQFESEGLVSTKNRIQELAAKLNKRNAEMNQIVAELTEVEGKTHVNRETPVHRRDP